jgi:hypothetical protein
MAQAGKLGPAGARASGSALKRDGKVHHCVGQARQEMFCLSFFLK